MTPQLQQAIKLLQLNRMELVEMINQELVENPVLEEAASEDGSGDSQEIDGQDIPVADREATSSDPESEQRRDEEAFSKPADPVQEVTQGKDDFNWESYVEEFNSNYQSPVSREVLGDLPTYDSVLTKTTTLEDHLGWQLSMITLSDEEKKLGEEIIGNLSDDGYLTANIADLAKIAKMELEDAEELLKMIHRFDPVGVASRDLRECLLTQAQLLDPRQPIVENIIDKHLGELEKKNYPAVARATGTPLPQVMNAIKVIMDLEPKPARAFTTADTQYITPDIYVHKVGADYVIVLNEDGLPKLKISPYYKNILSGQKGDTKEYVQDKLRSALWLIRSIHNRQKTIYKVTEAIVGRQRDFFEKGSQHLKPMILKDIASDIGMHESTVSRVTTNKYVHTPIGIFELKYFFNSSINSGDGTDSVASEAVKEKIKQLVSKEDPKRPLSDQKIVELLKSQNIDIARRTVAKYRDVLGVLPSSRRKKMI
ncbi:MAG: RNA polymerase factor sigma-54 [Xanthomonadaceae bacterium]|nr:RNA polymerase factor sigma-54 [Xanthomonadaceae bacterium]